MLILGINRVILQTMDRIVIVQAGIQIVIRMIQVGVRQRRVWDVAHAQCLDDVGCFTIN